MKSLNVYRSFLWVGALSIAAWVLIVLTWGLSGYAAWKSLPEASQASSHTNEYFLFSITRDRLDATVLPAYAASELPSQLNNIEPLANWNLPTKGIALAIIWFISLMGFGSLAATRLLPPQAFPLERLVFCFAAGFVILGLSIFILGLCGLLDSWVLFGLLLGGTVTGFREWPSFRRWFREAGSFFLGPFSAYPVHNLLVLFLGLIVALTSLVALTPPVQSDGLRYHLGAAQEWLKLGRITNLPLNAFSNFPFLPEMHFMLGLAVGSPESAQLMHLILALFAAASVASLVQRFIWGLRSESTSEELSLKRMPPAVNPILCKVSIAWLMAAVYLTTPAALTIATWPFIDHAVSLFFLMSFHAFLLAVRWSNRGSWLMAGLMTGGVLGTKYTALPHVAIIVTVGIAHWVIFSPPLATRSQRTISPKHLLLAVLTACTIGGAWFAKNYVFTGNPVYPLANQVFNGGDWTRESAELYRRKTEEKGVEKNWINLLRSPVDASLHWHRYEGHFLGPSLLASIIAGFVGTAAALFCRRTGAQQIVYAAVIAAGYYLTWFFTYQSNRMLVPFLALCLPLAGIMIHSCIYYSRFLSLIAVGSFACCIIYGGIWSLQWQYVRTPYPSVLRYVLGDMSREEYLYRAVPHVRAFDELAAKTRPGEKVLLVGEHRIFYASFEAVWSDWFDTPAILAILRSSKADSVEKLLYELRRLGVRWIFFNENELKPQFELYFRPRFSDKEWQIFEDLLHSLELEKKKVSPGLEIFRIPDEALNIQ